MVDGILGYTRQEYVELQAGLPGPMQLLPNHTYPKLANGEPWLATTPQIDLANIFAHYQLPDAPGLMLPSTVPSVQGDQVVLVPVNTEVNAKLKTRIAAAQAFHLAIQNAWHPNTHVLYSDGLRTDERVKWLASGREDAQTDSGDGTVPALSGSCSNIPPAFLKSREKFTGLSHSKVYADDHFNETVQEKIKLIASSP